MTEPENCLSSCTFIKREKDEGTQKVIWYLFQLSQTWDSMLPLKVLLTFSVTDGDMMLALAQSHVAPLNSSQHLQNAVVPSIVMLALHDTDVSTGTSTGTKHHKIPLNNHLNMLHAVVSLMAPSPHSKKTYTCHICVKLKCPQKPYTPIISCAHETTVSTYASYELTSMNTVTRNTGTHTFHIIGIWTWTTMHVTLHIYVPTLLIQST